MVVVMTAVAGFCREVKMLVPDLRFRFSFLNLDYIFSH